MNMYLKNAILKMYLQNNNNWYGRNTNTISQLPKESISIYKCNSKEYFIYNNKVYVDYNISINYIDEFTIDE
jgi:hypothetical protein